MGYNHCSQKINHFDYVCFVQLVVRHWINQIVKEQTKLIVLHRSGGSTLRWIPSGNTARPIRLRHPPAGNG